MSNKTLLDILESRADLSDYVFHFTKGENAIETLQKILEQKEIVDLNSNGFICFTEAPLYSLVDMFELFKKYPDPMFAPYGIGILKEDFYGNYGGRPVIYGPIREKKYIPSQLQWRYVLYEPPYDFTWLREWRTNLSTIEIDPSKHIVITNTIGEEIGYSNSFGEVSVDIEYEDGDYSGYASVHA